MLKINFLNNNATINQVKELADSVQFELCKMTITMNNESIEKQDKIIANTKDKYSDDEVDLAKIKVEKLRAENQQLEAHMEELQDIHDTVITAMIMPNEKGYANSEDTVKTVLRVIGCAENSRLFKYAIIPAFNNEELYNCLEAIHVNNDVTDAGCSINTKERIALYKQAQEELDNIMRDTFSLPIETVYTKALRVKLNATDRKVLHDVYVKGFTNKLDKKDNGEITFLSRKYTTAIKKNRKGEIDYSGISTDIAKLVIGKYAEIK